MYYNADCITMNPITASSEMTQMVAVAVQGQQTRKPPYGGTVYHEPMPPGNILQNRDFVQVN
jgi:hypothetical protein